MGVSIFSIAVSARTERVGASRRLRLQCSVAAAAPRRGLWLAAGDEPAATVGDGAAALGV